MSKPIVDLRERLAGIEDLRVAAGVLNWDQQTMMPRRGARARAESMATIERISHDMFTAPEIGRLIDSAAAGLNGSPPDSDDACLVRVVRRRWEKARRVPTELAAEIARASSLAEDVWIGARADSDFDAVRAVPVAQLRTRSPLR